MTCILCVCVWICLVVLTDRCKHLLYVAVLIVAPVVPFLTNGSLLSFHSGSLDLSLMVFGSFLTVQYDFLTHLLCTCPRTVLSHFSKKPCFLLVVNDTAGSHLDVHCYWVVIVDSPFHTNFLF